MAANETNVVIVAVALIAMPAGLPPRSPGTGPGAAAPRSDRSASSQTRRAIAGLIAGLAAVGLVYDAVGAVALVLGLVGGQLAADRVATRAWGAPAEARLAPRPPIGLA